MFWSFTQRLSSSPTAAVKACREPVGLPAPGAGRASGPRAVGVEPRHVRGPQLFDESKEIQARMKALERDRDRGGGRSMKKKDQVCDQVVHSRFRANEPTRRWFLRTRVGMRQT